MADDILLVFLAYGIAVGYMVAQQRRINTLSKHKDMLMETIADIAMGRREARMDNEGNLQVKYTRR